MEKIRIRLVRNKAELRSVLGIRQEVFGKEQKVPREMDSDGLDELSKSKHAVVFRGSTPIGCARIRFHGEGKIAVLQRIAILRGYRGKGLGKELMRFLVRYCKSRHITEIRMHAQTYLEPFYSKFGFIAQGGRFTEIGIPHVEMRLTIGKNG